MAVVGSPCNCNRPLSRCNLIFYHPTALLPLGRFLPPRRPPRLTQAAVARALPHPQVLGGAVEGGAGGRAPDGAAGWGKGAVRGEADAMGNRWAMLKARGRAENQLPSTDVTLPALITPAICFFLPLSFALLSHP